MLQDGNSVHLVRGFSIPTCTLGTPGRGHREFGHVLKRLPKPYASVGVNGACRRLFVA